MEIKKKLRFFRKVLGSNCEMFRLDNNRGYELRKSGNNCERICFKSSKFIVNCIFELHSVSRTKQDFLCLLIYLHPLIIKNK